MEIEIEVKSYLSEKGYDELIGKYGSGKKSVQTDKYFDTKDSFFFKKGVFLRIRDNRYFDIKYNPDTLDLSHTQCNEYRFDSNLSSEDVHNVLDFLKGVGGSAPALSGGLSLDELISSLGLKELVTIEKYREVIYLSPDVECVVDNIKGLGTFIELEVSKKDNKPQLEKLYQTLGLSHIPIGYVELFLKNTNPSLYLQGRYVLDGDT